MDTHPPSWVGNGSRFLHTVGVASSTVARVNLARPDQPIPSDADVTEIARGLVENFSLKELELYRCTVNTEGAQALAQALSVNKYLEYLGLARTTCGAHGVEPLAEALKVNQTLRTLDLSWTGVEDEAAAALAEALLVNNSLQRLLLDRNGIACDGAGALATALQSNRKLKYLGLSQNNIRAAGFSFLGQALATSTTLATLDVSMNGAAEVGLFSLFHALAHAGPHSALATLNVAYNHVGDTVAMAGVMLSNCTTLRELNLEGCQLAAGPAFDVFANSVRRAGNLASLNLAANTCIRDAGLAQLVGKASAGGARTGLRHLDLSDCGLTAGCGDALVGLVAMNLNLRTLLLQRNALGAAAGTALGKCASVANSSLTFLGLGNCGLGSAGVDKLVAELKYSTSRLTGLSLRNNQLGDTGIALLLPTVNHHGQFEYLDFAGNAATAETLLRLPDVFESNPRLPYVVLGDSTVITRDLLNEPWSSLHERQPTAPSAPLPPFCGAVFDVDPVAYAPSSGFASYSAATGSAVRRQCDQPTPHSVLFDVAGRPVKHCHVWRGNSISQTAPNLTSERYNMQVPDASAVEMENNLSGLLISDDQLRREFNRLDAGGRGYLDLEEMKRVYVRLEHFGVVHTAQDLRQLAKESGYGSKVNFDQFCVIYLKLCRA
jgi:Ran GTPase-activating protein (RanGAP) involved in mRNA processing and transport